MSRCPMKFNNPYPRDECECERDDCSWWLDRFQMCAIALEAYSEGLRREGMVEGVTEQMAVIGRRTV